MTALRARSPLLSAQFLQNFFGFLFCLCTHPRVLQRGLITTDDILYSLLLNYHRLTMTWVIRHN
jgi:hypothetical protein